MEDILIIGAGVAGLAAAAELANAGVHATIVEARDRIGGRIYTRHDPLCPVPIELGAEFIHGVSREIFDIVQARRMLAVEVSGSHLCQHDGKLSECDDFGPVEEFLKRLDAAEEQDDQSFESFVNASGIDDETKQSSIGFVEGFNAARKELVSVHALSRQQKAEEISGGLRSFRLASGYDSIAAELYRSISPDRCRIYLNTPIDQIGWSTERVRAGRFISKRAIITVPLGVLKESRLRIEPEPAEFRSSIGALEMGDAIRMVFRFRERFWDNREPLGSMSFMHAEGARDFRVWWSSMPFHAPVLTAWAGGPRADHANMAAALDTLAALFETERAEIESQLEAAYFHDWKADPYSCGSYSYVRAGGLPDADRLAEPFDNTLYFAGEHTDTTGNWGTVHGAIASGYRAARQVLESL